MDAFLRAVQPRVNLTRRVVLGNLAAIYFTAFASLGAQFIALYGPEGILPLGSLLYPQAPAAGRSVVRSGRPPAGLGLPPCGAMRL